jgi:FAD/FMN-containing dehydrogenase
VTELAALLGSANVITAPGVLERLSKDYSWFSPVLERELADWPRADVAVMPRSAEQVARVAELAARRGIPITVRGGGTGNYGQAVPRRGGILLLTSGLSRILGFEDASVRVEAGVRLGDLEREARRHGLELRIYPSTYQSSTVGGFIAGGAGGIGSVTWGTLRDGNVLSAKVVTIEERPRVCELSGDDLLSIVHAYGTTGIITEVTLPLARAIAWEQCALAFNDLDQGVLFGCELCEDASIPKRLVSLHEWPIPSFFRTLARSGGVAEGKALALLEVGAGATARAASLAAKRGGRLTWSAPARAYHAKSQLSLSDFSFNHTMLWARRADASMTYLQIAFGADNVLPGAIRLKETYGDEVLLHFEFIRFSGRLGVIALPLVRFTSRERLYEMMSLCQSLGARVIDPHIWWLGVDPRQGSPILSAKHERDPADLLNPGKIRTLESV